MHSKIGHSGANIVKEFFSSGTGDSTSLVTSMVIPSWYLYLLLRVLFHHTQS